MRLLPRFALLAAIAGGFAAAPAQAGVMLLCQGDIPTDLKHHYAIFGTSNTVTAAQDWEGFLERFGVPENARCDIYPSYEAANAKALDDEARLPKRWRVERSAWSPNGERFNQRRARPARTAPPSERPAPPSTRPPVAKASSTPPVMAPKGPTPNQLKYQRELGEHQTRLAEIERIKAATAAKHSAGQAAAAAELARHDREKAAADAARRRYEADLAAHQRLIDARQTKQDRERKVDWREAVVVCNLNPSDGQSQFGNWRCDGPLQMTYAKLGGTGGLTRPVLVSLSDACGGKPESVRDLGTAGTSRIFGCSFGLHPKSTGGFPLDAAKKHGISFVSGRAIYRCPEYVSACRTQ